MGILKVRDSNGNVQEVLVLRGEKGEPGEFTGGEVLTAHINDKNNPHGATAKQIGARPDTWMPTASEVGARPDTWMPTASEVGARPDTWMPTASEVGAAPIGFGLGGDMSMYDVSEIDSLLRTGCYMIYAQGGVGVDGVSFTYAFLSVIGNGENCTQELFPLQSPVKMMRARHPDRLETEEYPWDAWWVENCSHVVRSQGVANGWTYRHWDDGTAELWKTVTLSEYGDSRHIYMYEELPFSPISPTVTMTLQDAEDESFTQGAIVLSYSAQTTNSIKLSIIRDEGSLTDESYAIVSVHIKCHWKEIDTE